MTGMKNDGSLVEFHFVTLVTNALVFCAHCTGFYLKGTLRFFGHSSFKVLILVWGQWYVHFYEAWNVL